jgi:hypothetical protein
MPAFICVTCGVQYASTETPLAGCIVCRDARQYVNPSGQSWTTLPAMRPAYFNTFRRLEPGLMGIGVVPAFAIGQRALLLRTPQGNILWDCVSFLDDTTVTILNALGGIAAIAVSHPHFYASMIEWSHTFGSVPVYLHAADRKFVTRLDPVVSFWEDDVQEIVPGVTLLRCGGHFAGSAVLHWAQGSGGNGTLLTGDTLHVGPDRHLSFMRSYPNLIPLSADAVQRIAEVLAPWPFDGIYGAFWDRVIPTDGKDVLARSVDRYVEAVSVSPDD